MTVNKPVEINEVVELQVEFATYYEVLKSKCDKRDLESPYEEMKVTMRN